jgi:hypothetical protein
MALTAAIFTVALSETISVELHNPRRKMPNKAVNPSRRDRRHLNQYQTRRLGYRQRSLNTVPNHGRDFATHDK